MNERIEFMRLMTTDDFEALQQFISNPDNIFSLFTDASHVKELFQSNAFTAFEIISKSEDRLQKLIATPQQFYDLYNLKPTLATLFMIKTETHFQTVFQNIEDIVDLALLDTTCGLHVFPYVSSETKGRFKDATICESLFTLAAKETSPNLCFNLVYILIPMRNISHEDFEKLYLIMKNNPSIEDRYAEELKEKYDYDNSSLLSSLGFFATQVGESFAVGARWAQQSLTGFNYF